MAIEVVHVGENAPAQIGGGDCGSPLVGEELKRAAFTGIDLRDRNEEAAQHVSESPLQAHADRAQVGPYPLELLCSSVVQKRLSNDKEVGVATFGRNERRRNFLKPALAYIRRSTGDNHNVFYADGNSDDDSAGLAKDMGFQVFRRSETMSGVDIVQLAEVLRVDPGILRGEKIKGQPQLRKGIEDFSFRLGLSKLQATGYQLPGQIILVDSDLTSVQGGLMAPYLQPDQIYYPLELMAAAMLEIEVATGRHPATIVVYTGSPYRNNEAIMAGANTLAVEMGSPFRSVTQQRIAREIVVHLGNILHPVTGELALEREAYLNAPGATAWGVEPVRNAYLAGICAAYNGRPNVLVEEAKNVHPYSVSVDRGTQQRVDALADWAKEWRYCMGDAPQIGQLVSIYSITIGRHMYQWTLDDYIAVNAWLAQLTEVSRIDPDAHRKVWDRRSADRVIPPIPLLVKEGVIVL